MNLINKQKAGLAFGAFLGIWHAFWSLLVMAGWAQPLADWILKLHFIKPFYVITAFHLGTAVILVIITSLIGYIVGWILAAIWNWLHQG